MKMIGPALIVMALISICMAGRAPEKVQRPATISLSYSVEVPKNIPYKITETYRGEAEPQALHMVDQYLASHRAAFLGCVRDYVQGKSLADESLIVQMRSYEYEAIIAGRKLAKDQLDKLEKELGKEKLVARLIDEGYADKPGK